MKIDMPGFISQGEKSKFWFYLTGCKYLDMKLVAIVVTVSARERLETFSLEEVRESLKPKNLTPQAKKFSGPCWNTGVSF